MKDGGPAFQVDTPGTSHYGLVCVNLRDYFAAKAMQGMLSSPENLEVFGKRAYEAGESNGHGIMAGVAYQVADAMLKAREKDDG